MSAPAPTPKDTATAVPADFARGIEPGSRLPGRHGRSMAEVWGLTEEQVKRVYQKLKRKDKPVKRKPKAAEPPKVAFAGSDIGTEYVLRDWQGAYLHQSCLAMTKVSRLAWRGSDRQLERVRIKFPDTKDLIASEVS